MEGSSLEYRLLHAHDGQNLASKIRQCLRRMYQVKVQIVNIEGEGEMVSSLPSLRGSPAPSRPTNRRDWRPPTNKNGVVFLLTPVLCDYLTRLQDHDRNILKDYLESYSHHISINCVGTTTLPEKPESWLDEIFTDFTGTWRWLRLGNTLEAFWSCVSGLAALTYNFVEGDDQEDLAHILTTLMPKCRLLNNSAVSAGESILVLLETSDVLNETLIVRYRNSQLISANKIADRVYQFEAPECEDKSAEFDIFSSDGTILGVGVIEYKQQQSTNRQRLLGSLLLNASNSIAVLYKAISSVSQREEVDQELSDWLKQKRVFGDPDADRFEYWIEQMLTASQGKINREFPTLLHLVAKFNLLATAKQLLEMKGIARALNVQNNLGLTPEELARKLRHAELAQLFAAEMQADDPFDTSMTMSDEDDMWIKPPNVRFANENQEEDSSVGYIQPSAWFPTSSAAVASGMHGTEAISIPVCQAPISSPKQCGLTQKDNVYLRATGGEIKFLKHFNPLGQSCPRNLNFFGKAPLRSTSNSAPHRDGYPSDEVDFQSPREIYKHTASLSHPFANQATCVSSSASDHVPKIVYTDINPNMQSSVTLRKRSATICSPISVHDIAFLVKPTLHRSPPRPHVRYSTGNLPKTENERHHILSWPLGQGDKNNVGRRHAEATNSGGKSKTEKMSEKPKGNGYERYNPGDTKHTDDIEESIYETIEFHNCGPSKV